MVYRTKVALAGTSALVALGALLSYPGTASAPQLALKPRTIYVHRTVKVPHVLANPSVIAPVEVSASIRKRYVAPAPAKAVVQKPVKLAVRPKTDVDKVDKPEGSFRFDLETEDATP